MSKNTSIQWCDSTVNPVMGCSGCELWNDARKTCYAGQLHQRRKMHKGFSPDFDTPKLFPGRMVEAAKWSDLTGCARPDKPWLHGLPRLIFVSDMGDALSERNAIDPSNKPLSKGSVPFDFLKQEIIDNAASANGRRHRWLWLTKRPQRLAQFSRWLKQEHHLDFPDNIWVGTSVTSKASLGRLAHLRDVGGKDTIRFVSVEPLWEEVSLAGRLSGMSWVIVGGESEQGDDAKEFKVEWARKLRDDCAKAGVAFFLKQLGSFPTLHGKPFDHKGDSHAGDWNRFPSDLRVRQMPIGRLDVPVARSSSHFPNGAIMLKTIKAKAIDPKSYQQWIIQTVKAAGGHMWETHLDAALHKAYSKHWNKTDRGKWMTKRNVVKWKQNVASAKSGLDRKGVVVRVGRGKKMMRVLLIPLQAHAAIEWWTRQRKRRKNYEYVPLPQPKARQVVPVVPAIGV